MIDILRKLLCIAILLSLLPVFPYKKNLISSFLKKNKAFQKKMILIEYQRKMKGQRKIRKLKRLILFQKMRTLKNLRKTKVMKMKKRLFNLKKQFAEIV